MHLSPDEVVVVGLLHHPDGEFVDGGQDVAALALFGDPGAGDDFQRDADQLLQRLVRTLLRQGRVVQQLPNKHTNT